MRQTLVSDTLFLWGGVLTVLCWGVLWYEITVDDSYIVLRYAHNLAVGNGPVFNVTERVEGYSCPLFVFGLGFVEWLGGDPLWASKLVGLASALGLVVLLYSSLRRLMGPSFIVGLVTMTFALVPGIHVYSCSGMETVPFACAVALTITLPILAESHWIMRLGLPLLLLSVATLRPEGLLLSSVLGLFWLLRSRDYVLRGGILVAAALVVALLMMRHAYYDAWLPNTYLAKPSPLLSELREAYVSEGILAMGTRWLSLRPLRAVVTLFAPFGLLLCCFAVLRARGKWPLALSLVPALLAAGVGGVFFEYAPADWMPERRFALPFMLPFVLICGVGLDSISGQSLSRKVQAVLLLLLLVWGFVSVRATVILWHGIRSGTLNTALDAARLVEIGKWLRDHGKPRDRVLAHEVGALGYFSQQHVIDHEGLVTKEVALVISEAGSYSRIRRGGNATAVNRIVQHCLAQRPNWFLVRSGTDVPLTLGQAVPPTIAYQAIQNAFLQEIGDSMSLAHIFPLRSYGSDKYLLLQARQ